MHFEPGTITFLVVFTIGVAYLVKKWRKERNEPKAPPVRLVRIRQGRTFGVVDSKTTKAQPPAGKTQVRIGKDLVWVDDDLLSPKEDE